MVEKTPSASVHCIRITFENSGSQSFCAADRFPGPRSILARVASMVASRLRVKSSYSMSTPCPHKDLNPHLLTLTAAGG